MIQKKLVNWQLHIILSHVKHGSTLEQGSLKGHNLLVMELSVCALMPTGDIISYERLTLYERIQGTPGLSHTNKNRLSCYAH